MFLVQVREVYLESDYICQQLFHARRMLTEPPENANNSTDPYKGFSCL